MKTKYDIDEEVFVMYKNKVEKGSIDAIEIGNTKVIVYSIKAPSERGGTNHLGKYIEEQVFKTKSQLLESL